MLLGLPDSAINRFPHPLPLGAATAAILKWIKKTLEKGDNLQGVKRQSHCTIWHPLREEKRETVEAACL
jgi:hypothetical protein